MSKIIFSNILTAIVILFIGYFIFSKNNTINAPVSNVESFDIASTTEGNTENQTSQTSSGTKTFVFDNFHGSTNVSLKFQFSYPANFYNQGQYWSPEPIEYYDVYSVKAPFYYDLILASIFDQTDFKNQIDTSKRKSPDRHGKIGSQEFQRYDLIDSGSYGGESAGRVIIYVGPKIKINGLDYILVFHWEEKPLTAVIQGNNSNIFEMIVQSLKFTSK